MISNNDLMDKINAIEADSEIRSVEAHSQAQNQWRDAIRKRLIFVWLPSIALGLIIIVWMVMQIPSFGRCYSQCMKKSELNSMQRQEDCEFVCRIRNP